MQLLAMQIIDDIVQFFRRLFFNLANGLFIFGNVWDIILVAVDVTVCTLVVYFILKLMRDTRAWQLLKGIVFIVVFTQVSGLLGLQTMNYLLTNSLSILAVAFVIIFQPELRRALEKVGRRSVNLLSSVTAGYNEEADEVDTITREVSIACAAMARERTGALIVFERNTRLGELTEQPNAVIVDAAVTAMNLQQIFYEGSPMHDGAVLVRNGRIYAARCHVPLSDDTRVRDGLGTRHRAAIGASEMGDSFAVVVSEEHGTISLTLEGRLYRIESGEALRRVLEKLLKTRTWRETGGGSFIQRVRGLFLKPDESPEIAEALASQTAEAIKPKKRKNLLKLASLLIALALWALVQSAINPISLTTVTVPLQTDSINYLDQYDLDFAKPSSTIQLQIRSRKKYIDRMTPSNIVASIDFGDLDFETIMQEIESGHTSSQQKMQVHVQVDGVFDSAYEVASRTPSAFYVRLYPVER
ncbi:MAG: diadenylate cyclase CdaA [Fastidiosipilaceae bacterium]